MFEDLSQNDTKYSRRHSLIMTIKNVDIRDSGVCRCRLFWKSENNRYSSHIQLNIPRHHKAAKYMYRVKEGTAVSLQCDPQISIPPITELWWQKRMNGHFRNLTNSLKYSYGTVTAPNLYIKHVRFSEAVEYTCYVANAFGYSHVEMEVQLGKPPTVSAATKVYRPIRGGTVTMTCNINNETRIWWKRFDGRNEIDIDSYKSSGGETAIVTIQNVQAVDDVDYRCYGENEFGSNYDTIKISSRVTHNNPTDYSAYLNTALTIQEVSEFYPGSDKPIEMNHSRLDLDSSEKKNTNLFVFHLQLTNKETKFSIPVKIYKTTNWKEVDKYLPLEVLSQLLDVTRLSKSKSALLMTNDELDICMAGILKVCADVFRAIDESSSFSIFQLAKEVRNQHPKIFQEITDYDLCYLLIQHHLESNHVYDAID
ncbi:unnamed protein product [Mytilus coruscus]|uniref:Ig-like domain-containing protein n=1 Tax=Mytilus coruscus TaxID=42192 RepID=A0A6J8BWG9_MYTCO|nr:unnamed protein product [Mytilus coruscus]